MSGRLRPEALYSRGTPDPEDSISDDDFLRELAQLGDDEIRSFEQHATIPNIPPDGRNICHVGPRLNERQLPRRRGFPFAVVFAYPPPHDFASMGSPMIYTGDLGTIKEALLDGPTHHGFVVHYRNGMRVCRPQGKSVILLGRHALHYPRRPCSLVLDYVHPRDHSMRRRSIGRMKRAGFYLLFHNEHGQEKVLHRWRRLPRTYLQQLKDADECLDRHLDGPRPSEPDLPGPPIDPDRPWVPV